MIYLKPIIPKVINAKKNIMEMTAMTDDLSLLEAMLETVTMETIATAFKRHYSFALINVKELSIDVTLLKMFDMELMEKVMILPYDVDNEARIYYFAVSDLADNKNRNDITTSCRENGFAAQFAFSFEQPMKETFERLKREQLQSKEKARKSVPQSIASLNSFDAAEWVNTIIEAAITIGASDVHIERLENALQTRYRVDGVMTNKRIHYLTENEISNIYVRLKVVSNMDIAEKRKPQDGRIDNFPNGSDYYDLRVSTVSTIFGEKCVMRIFNKTSKTLSFDELGFPKEDSEKISAMLRKQNGIIYMGGATGSGKTTSLYTMIEEVNDDEINIYTIEDPVEKSLKNVNQIQVDPLAGIGYANTLKALLRQDPDVIVVGEIRDAETAELAVRASLTGHLVLSTVHANNAIDTISRLMDMGIEPYMLSTSSLGFLSQRLVRLLCPACKRKIAHIDTDSKLWINKVSTEYGLESNENTEFYEPIGCPNCSKGYKGRIAIVEVIKMSESLKIMLSKGVDLSIIKQTAIEEGFVPMQVNGLKIAMQGRTSIEEIVRQLS